MLLGALISAGAPAAWLEGLPARLGAPEVSVQIEAVNRCGVRATKVSVVLPGGRQEGPAEIVDRPPDDHSHGHSEGDHGHAHAHHGPHRHIGDLIRAVERASLSAWVRERAVRAFRLLG